MNRLVQEFYQTQGESPFAAVLSLANCQKSWEELQTLSPRLPRGYFELSRLSAEDRVVFTRDFWLNLLPYHPSVHPRLIEFFAQLDDVAPMLCQLRKSGEWTVEMVYSLRGDRSFFRGRLPASEGEVDELIQELPLCLPNDYLSFLRIHNGFGKLSEWGVLAIQEVQDKKRELEAMLLQLDRFAVDPSSLIPFYESPLGASWQCFYADWYPGSEMGNVYLSGIDYTISDYTDRKEWADQFAFPTFLEWLVTFLEGRSID